MRNQLRASDYKVERRGWREGEEYRRLRPDLQRVLADPLDIGQEAPQTRLMRAAVVGASVAAGVLLGVQVAAGAHPRYSAGPTARCLRAAGAGVVSKGAVIRVTISLPGIVSQIYWQVGDGEFVMFTHNPTAAARLVARLFRVNLSMGASKAEARHMIGSKANAVWVSIDFTGLTAARTALLKRCLR